ncbi:MAG: DUF4012 domain-containing protein [bacterium]|nr:DUF4012 domain-containing protein [bacterium]
MPDAKIVRAMFDIKPVNQSGQVDFEKISQIDHKIDLRKNVALEIVSEESAIVIPVLKVKDKKAIKEDLVKELNEELQKKVNLVTILAKVGGSVITVPHLSSNRRRLVTIKKPKIEPKIEPEIKLLKLEAVPFVRNVDEPGEPVTEKQVQKPVQRKKYFMVGLSLLAVLVIVGIFNKDGFEEKVVRDGNAAVQNLENAKADIEKFDFAAAAKNFTLANYNFSAASDRLNLLGNSFGSFLGAMPGLGKLKSAQNLTEAGENIAKAGEMLSLAADNLSKTNFVSYLALSGNSEKPLTDFINSFREALVFAQKKFKTASILLAEVDPEIIPEEKRQNFLDFKEQLPIFEEFLKGSLDYSDFLLELVGQSGPKKYLVLFQNNTELRATGGFFGSYALADFNRGFLRGFEVKDVYETDGQAKTNIIPPKELQHITPVWGMRDANWFINFPDSAKKIMQLYTENDGGPTVDGVITITPTVISKILKITGPVELPEYQKTITSENFLAEIQEEVEYGPNRVKPKQILVDFSPKFLEKLGELDKEKWAGIFKILNDAAEERHILAYFKNSQMEKTAVQGGFGGEIKSVDKDYLSVIHTNVKGSKTDAYTDNIYQLQSGVNTAGQVENNLSITRVHKGGKTGFGFYNRINYDFVRVVVPKGSKLLEINGYSVPNFQPIVDYGDGQGFVTDSDLVAYEQKATKLKPGVTQLSEKDKTVFGFWLIVEPGKTKTVTLKYETPVKIGDNRYSLLVQKQPGTLEDLFNFSFALPEGKQIIYRTPGLTMSGDSINFETKLLKDTEIEVKFQ